MSAALGLQGDDPSSAAAANLGRDQACPDVGREFEALANKHGGAGGAAWESSYFDSSAMTGPLQPRDEAELLQTTATTPKMPTVALHESERPGSRERYTDGAGEVEQAKADFTRPSESPWPSPPLLPTTSSCHPPHHVPALLVRPGSAATVTAVSMMGPSAPVSNAPREPHRRGSSAPLQLHPMASVSSLGTLPDLDTDVDLHRPRRIMFGPASWSRVSLPSDMDDAPRILGDEEAEQCAAVRLTPSTPEHDHDHPWSLSPSAKHDSKARSTMDRIVGKIRRSSNPTDPKASSPSQPQLKKPLDRLGGLFSRQHGRSHEPPPTPSVVAESLPGPEPHTPEPSSYPPSMDRLRPSTSQPPTPGHPPFNTSPGHTRPSSSLGDTSFQGQLPPPGGYFAPDSFAQFRDAQDIDLKLAQQINAENIDRGVGGSHRIPSPVGIPRHSGSGRSAGSISGQSSLSPNSPRYPAPASPPLHQPHTYHHPASPYYQHHHHHQQQQQPPPPPPPPQHPQPYTTHLVSPVPSPVPRTPPSRGRSQERTYAQELHLRSRSPKTFAPRPEERNIPSTDITDPAHRLGTFLSTNRRASRIGDQERPWKLTLPGGGGDEDTTSEGTLMSLANYRRHTTSGVLPAPEEEHLPSYEEDMRQHAQSEMLQPSVYVPDEKSRPLGGETDDQSQGQGQGQGYGQAQSQYLHPTRGQGRQINNSGSPVELPVRRDDDSGEEITMSSTAYPGQEWRPVGYSDWEM